MPSEHSTRAPLDPVPAMPQTEEESDHPSDVLLLGRSEGSRGADQASEASALPPPKRIDDETVETVRSECWLIRDGALRKAWVTRQPRYICFVFASLGMGLPFLVAGASL